MVREGGEEDNLLQLPEVRTCHSDCPDTKSKPSTYRKPYKKKALKATWDPESESKEKLDTTNVCFMANENTSKVTSEFSLEECKLSTMDELREDFEEISHNYDFPKKKYLKKEK